MQRSSAYMEFEAIHTQPLIACEIHDVDDGPADSTSSSPDKRLRRQTLRARPAQLLEKQNAEPPSPLKNEPSLLRPRPSQRGSLFNLFSRSKPSDKDENESAAPLRTKTSMLDLRSFVQSKDPAREPTRRAQSAMSLRESPTKSSPTKLAGEAIPQVAGQAPARKASSWDPPPLFQAYPQAIRHGVFSVSTLTPETMLQKTKSKGGVRARTVNMDEASMPDSAITGSKATVRAATFASGGSASDTFASGTPRKIFILVTMGYLLQYAEAGLSDRLPEKVLQLGQDSAAFACRDLPGWQNVLQVSRTVDQKGIVVASSSSFLSKIGLRSAAAKRTTSTFLVSITSIDEMNAWIMAIRREIEALGGQQARPDPGTRPKLNLRVESTSKLRKTPSQSHRYQVRRDPRMVVSPTMTEVSEEHVIRPLMSHDSEALHKTESEATHSTSRASPTKQRSKSSVASDRSSVAASLGQQQLNALRNSRRFSHGSTAGTLATTLTVSGTSSDRGSPPSEQSLKDSSESARDGVFAKTPYRSQSSYALSQRLSPEPTGRQTPLPSLDVASQIERHSAIAESPITGRNDRVQFSQSRSPSKVLTPAKSAPNLIAIAETTAKRDSELLTRFMGWDGTSEAPSKVTEALAPSTWTSDCLLSIDIAAAAASAPEAFSPPPVLPPRSTMRHARGAAELFKNSTQTMQRLDFSRKPINYTPTAQTSPRNRKLHSETADLDDISPKSHTTRGVSAKSNAANRMSIVHESANVPTSAPSDVSTQDLSATASPQPPAARHSLFPLSPDAVDQVLPPSTSGASQSDMQSSVLRVPGAPIPRSTNRAVLQRPISMQVRSDHTGRHQDIRSSTYAPTKRISGLNFTSAPTRTLKVSRSTNSLAQHRFSVTPVPNFSTPDPFAMPPPALAEESVIKFADVPNPLFSHAVSSLPSGLQSRTGSRRLKTYASLPQLDLGLPIVGLGPPAPPPQAPLPTLPVASRFMGASPSNDFMPGTAMGIRV